MPVMLLVILVGVFAATRIPVRGMKENNVVKGQQQGQTDIVQSKTQQETTAEAATRQDTVQQNTTEVDTNKQESTQGNTQAGRKSWGDIKIRAVYLSGDSASNPATIKRIIDLSKSTELNAVVIDVKEGGKVNYESNVPEVKQYGAYQKLYNPETLLATLHENNIYVIGRVVCFRDTVLAEKRVDMAVKRASGQIWREGKFAWTNPYNEEVWKYNIDIAKEAVDKGFDEIQFDYVRFPTTSKTEVSYGQNMPSKADTITKFLETAKREIHDGKGVPLSADVFGIICESAGDVEGIGQVLERVGKDIDCISPMLYPSHYANASHGSNGNGVGQSINGVLFTAPDMEPYKVVYNTLVRAKGRISKVEGYNAKMRPYLQSFSATWLPNGYYQKYGVEQIRQQIKAVYDAGYDQWILWDPANAYPTGAFEKKQ